MTKPRLQLFFLGVAAVTFMVGSASLVVADQPPPAPAELTVYIFGSPTGDDVEMLELINRARANPPAEGQRLVAGADPSNNIGIDLARVVSDFNGYPARPPLAFNVHLEAAATDHLADMIRLGHAMHDSPDGTPADLRAQQYGYMTLGAENVGGFKSYFLAVRPWDIHALYELHDTGHRDAIMEFDGLGHSEVGLSCFLASGQWSVEDFGDNLTWPLLTGVVFSDNANTGFYQSGEGVSDVLVTSNASSFYAVTVNGAYTLPLDLVPAYNADSPATVVTVTFKTSGGSMATKTITLGHTVDAYGNVYYSPNIAVRYDNAKADWVQPATGSYSLSPMHSSFFVGEVMLANGVRYLAFPNGNIFGYYTALLQNNYLYHFDLGYEYVFDAADGKGGVYLYDFASHGFFYTSPTFPFPYLYDFNRGSTVYYYPDPNNIGRYNTNGVRYFYNFGTGEIVID